MRLFLWVVAAFIYDLLIVAALSVLLSALFVVMAGEGFQEKSDWRLLFQGSWLAMVLAYWGISWLKTGQTIGMTAWHLKVVRHDEHSVTPSDVVRRLLFATINACCLNIGWFGYLLPTPRSTTDHFSDTRIIRIEKKS